MSQYFVNPCRYLQIILVLVTVQLLIALMVGVIVRIILRSRYNVSTSSSQLFNKREYTPLSQRRPEKYSHVLVKYNFDGSISSETFYMLMGDWSYFEYVDDQVIRTGGLRISNLSMCSILIPGLAMIVLVNLLKVFQILTLKSNQSLLLTQLSQLAPICFFVPAYSSFISLQIKNFIDLFYIKDRSLVDSEEIH
ncbi:hypothetical protein H6G89_02730 [Oscillatoria sp. FACHB-1407]|uniref:hypothetical protein n=1 Tax=Oscillatoria sp. FACHB-1407 TaxID=2692847 RepID=UPI0019B48FD8|nr:hypothetical protein [Oscillatoria sp. FACHB-1407]